MTRTCELHPTTQDLIDAIAKKENKQRDIAEKYQAAFNVIPNTEWGDVNSAIAKRWPSKSGLVRVKTMAWKIYEEKYPPK